MVRVAKVEAGSIAEELGIVPGTEIHRVNGRDIQDFLDWEFLAADEELTVEIIHPTEGEIALEIERDAQEPWGISLEPPRVRGCANHCEFCFIEGLPQGLRKTLYLRDDDYRLSFAYGNFATLSNVKERDVRRILEYRLSPLYVSVHATNAEARKTVLNNPRAPEIVPQLRRLAEGGIQFHCQFVVVPGLNDGDVLEESLSDLWSLGDAVLSAAVVPVGLTQFSHLYTGKTMNRDIAGSLLRHVERWQERAKRERGETWVFGSDELYLLAGEELPSPEHYGEFAQIENGIGSITRLRMSVANGLDELPRFEGRKIGVVTGTAMREMMPPLIADLARATGAEIELLVMENSLFGPTTTASGLLVGADIRRALGDRTDFDFALIPAETINENGVFLDDARLEDVRADIPIPMFLSYDFIDALTDDEVQEALAVAA